MVKVAVILAAGLGSRLKEKTKNKPKGFLELNGISLIKRSIDNLLACGIRKIYIGTGYLSEVYEEFSKSYPEIACIKCYKFETTSSMFTLNNMKNFINEDFILLESDLLYEKKALECIINDKKEDIILSSGKTNSNDEVYIEVENNYLISMSKDKNELKSIYSELVGISKISLNRYNLMCKEFINQDNEKIDYEYIMVKTTSSLPFYVKKVDDLIWCEIDDSEHLSSALNKILPKINSKDNYGKSN